MFQKSFVDPALQVYQRQLIPALKESFLGMDESGSSSLNRALAQGASDVSTGLGQQQMNFFQQQQAAKQGALGQLGGLAGQRTFEPSEEHTQGILGDIIKALGPVLIGLFSGGPAGAAAGGLSGVLQSSGGR